MGNQVSSTEEDLRSHEGVVEGEPGQSSLTSHLTSETSISRPEIVTPLMEDQSSGGVIIGARTCGSNVAVSQPVGKAPFSLFGPNASSFNLDSELNQTVVLLIQSMIFRVVRKKMLEHLKPLSKEDWFKKTVFLKEGEKVSCIGLPLVLLTHQNGLLLIQTRTQRNSLKH